MEEQSRLEHLLLVHGVKPTSNRIVVLKALLRSSRPMSLSELEEVIVSIDKSGVFRTLRLFDEHHVVHSIDDGSGGTRYELCHSHSSDDDDDLHPHFFCERCRRTFCLHACEVPVPVVPAGFVATSVNYVVKGLCAECSRRV